MTEIGKSRRTLSRSAYGRSGAACAFILVLISMVLPLGTVGRPISAESGAFSMPQAATAPLLAQQGYHQPDGDSARADASAHAAFLPIVLNDSGASSGVPFGVQLFVPSFNGPTVVKTSQAGAGWVRVPFYWDKVEPQNTTPENYQWQAAYDAQLAALSARNIQVILTLAGNPWWAATYAAGPIDKVDVRELVEFMEAAVARYGQPPFNVKHWEFYNEPDNGAEIWADGGYGYFGNTPEAYVGILRAVYGPVKAVDPQAQIVFGGIAYDNWSDSDPPGPFIHSFLDRVLAAGGGNYFDVMNFHYYPLFHKIWDPYGRGIIGKATYLRRKLEAYGVRKPILCTEAGYWSDTAHGGSDERQSRYVVQALARGMAAELRTTIWFFLVDEIPLGTYKYGLLNPDLSPKPAYYAYQTFAQHMSSAEYVRALAPGKDGSDQLEGYEYDIRFSPDRIVVAWSNDGASHTLVLQTNKVTIAEKYGGETTVLDGDDGVVDGRVEVGIGPSPRYVTFRP
jgi:hypothetical protein